MRLRLIDEPAAEAISSGSCPPGCRCAPDYPADGDRIAGRLFLERCAAGLDPRPYGTFLVCLPGSLDQADSAALTVGGVGFHGGVDDLGRVEIGYGIVPSHQRHGYATAALGLLIDVAVGLGATGLTAETETGNAASRAVLRRHGFVETHASGGTRFFELALGSRR